MKSQSERGETRRRVSRHAPFALLCALALAAPGIARAADLDVEVAEHEGTYRVRGQFTTTVSRDIVWDVLTDYGHIPAFVQSMKKSVVEPRANGHLLVRQDVAVGVFPLKRTAQLALDVREEGRTRISFRDELGKDFHSYVGQWALESDSARTVVRYALDADPVAGLPALFGRGVLSHGAHDLLKQVQVEMERRARVRGLARRGLRGSVEPEGATPVAQPDARSTPESGG